MENRDSKYGTNRIASLLSSIAALIALLATFFTPAIAQSFDGLWQSQAYGLLVEIRGGKMSVSQITSISCQPWWTAKRSESIGNKSEVVFKRGDAVIHLTPVLSPDMLIMRESVSISSMELRRVNDRPENCSEKLANTPQNNYAVFYQTFAEQFALFPLYHTAWAAIDRNYRPRVTASTTPDELFGILREMILPFHNAHTNINAASINLQYVGYRPASEIGLQLQPTSTLSLNEILDLFNQEAQRTTDIIESKYSGAKVPPYCNDVV